jgi:DNA polymerase
MRAVLQAISEELARLKAEGEQVVPVTEEALAGLRALVRGRAEAAGPAKAEHGSSSLPVPQARGASLADPAGIAERKDFAPRAPEPASAPSLKLSPAAPAAAVLPPPPVVSLPDGDKAARWAALRDMATNHPVCLANVRPGKKAVLGVGALDAKIFFVGEAPGAEEEVNGEPFVGPAGQLLTKMIGAMGLKREQVYIGNILCWRPQMPTPPGAEQIGNRPPTSEEMAFCLPFLRASIEIVQPDLLVALGGTAAQGLLGEKFTTLGAARSRWHDFSGKPLMVTYHPSYLLRNGSNKSKRMVWEDLLQVMEKAGLPISEKQRGYFMGA